MLMGFVNSDPLPPRLPGEGSAADEPPLPGHGEGDLAGLAAAARAATSRYRRRPESVGKYAWAISLGLHAVVLVGAFVAIRYYFPHAVATAPVAVSPAENAEPNSIILSPDATDAVHGGWIGGMTLTADSAFNNDDERAIPPTLSREPQTIATLKDLAPRSGVESLSNPMTTVIAPSAAFGRNRTPKE
jgi:hypothetical protein